MNCIYVMLNVMYNADPSSTYFTIKMHHGGHFKENSYIMGKIAYYDYCDHEKMSSIVLSDMGQKLGYTLPFGFITRMKIMSCNGFYMMIIFIMLPRSV